MDNAWRSLVYRMCRISHGEEVGRCSLLLKRDVSTLVSHLGKLRPQEVIYMGHRGREKGLEKWVGYELRSLHFPQGLQEP